MKELNSERLSTLVLLRLAAPPKSGLTLSDVAGSLRPYMAAQPR